MIVCHTVTLLEYCLILESGDEDGVERQGYIFSEFAGRHFAAWDTELAVRIQDYDNAIEMYSEGLCAYGDRVEAILDQGKS